MENLEKKLKEETEKWIEAFEAKTKGLKVTDERGNWAANNMNAYLSDCKHFYKKGDFLRSFEAIIYAYGIYETALHSGLIGSKGVIE